MVVTSQKCLGKIVYIFVHPVSQFSKFAIEMPGRVNSCKSLTVFPIQQFAIGWGVLRRWVPFRKPLGKILYIFVHPVPQFSEIEIENCGRENSPNSATVFRLPPISDSRLANAPETSSVEQISRDQDESVGLVHSFKSMCSTKGCDRLPRNDDLKEPAGQELNAVSRTWLRPGGLYVQGYHRPVIARVTPWTVHRPHSVTPTAEPLYRPLLPLGRPRAGTTAHRTV